MAKSRQRELFILRHAKSDWESEAETDFDRPLAKRGNKDAPAMGKWMKKQKLLPDHIVSSPAERAKQTIYAVTKELDIAKKHVHFDKKIYMGNLEVLLKVLAECPQKAKTVMLVGHNPGLDELLQYLVRDPPLTGSGKLITTACLARIALPDDWAHLPRHCGTLISITRPRDIV
jgi:phosphohistidine phosphatase